MIPNWNRFRNLAVSASIAALTLTGCGGGGGNTSVAATSVPVTTLPTVPPPISVADIEILFLGNSHTSFHDVPGTVATLVRAARPGKTVSATTAPGSLFLDERAQHQETLQLLRSRDWSAVVLQAQKLSASWTVTHPVQPAAELVGLARGRSAIPVLFPEWARRGIDESDLIYGVYVSIAKVQAACVSPIPQAWDLALARRPTMALHVADGNHATPSGAFLAALVLYATLTGELPQNLPDVSVSGVDSATQQFLRGIATEAIQAVSPRLWCPGEKTL